MKKEELLKLADSFQKKADAAFENYQETCWQMLSGWQPGQRTNTMRIST